jgi:hypothetical protein
MAKRLKIALHLSGRKFSRLKISFSKEICSDDASEGRLDCLPEKYRF